MRYINLRFTYLLTYLHGMWTAIGTIMSSLRLSVCLSVTLCIVAYRTSWQQKCLNKWIGSALVGTRFYNFQPLNWPWALKLPTCKISTSGVAMLACWPWLFQTTVCSYTVRRRAEMSEQAKSTIGSLSNSWVPSFRPMNFRVDGRQPTGALLLIVCTACPATWLPHHQRDVE